MTIEVVGFDIGGSIIATIDGTECCVPNDMANRDRRMIWDEWEMAPAPEGTPDSERVRINTIPPYVPPEPSAYRLFKSVFINRMTASEAVTLESILAGADAKLRLMFNSVEYFVSDDPLFATLHGAVAGALGAARADELLAV